MGKAVIRNGRWVREDGESLDPIEKYQMHNQIDKIHEFASGVTKLTYTKIEILSHILHARPDQERAILKILTMDKQSLNSLI